MYTLVEPHTNYQETLKELEKYSYTPIILFKISLSNKNQTKENIQKALDLKKKIKPKYSAVQITLNKIENSTIGTINSLKSNFDIVIGLGGLNKINRYFLEQTQVDFLQDPQNSIFQRKIDYIHHLNSGLNHVLCNFAKEKEIEFIFSLNFTELDKKIVAKELGRINQNLKFANKLSIPSNINFIISSTNQVKSLQEIKGILSLFDLSTQQQKQSINILEQKITKNKKEKSPNYVSEDIEIIE